MKRLRVGAVGWDLDRHIEHCQSLNKFIKAIKQIDEQLSESNIKLDLLLCAGLTVDETKKNKIIKELNNIENIKNILFEKITDNNKKFLDTNYCLFRNKDKKIKVFPSQLFATTYRPNPGVDTLTKKKTVQLSNYILEGKRTFKVENINFILLVCGENNIIKGNKKEGMLPLILKFSKSDEDRGKIEEIFNKSIMLNPSHTPYGLNGRKRLTMMENITKYSSKILINKEEHSIKLSNYLHANNYTLGYKKVYLATNMQIHSKYPNGSFLFSGGKYQSTDCSFWKDTKKNFILNTWSLNIFN